MSSYIKLTKDITVATQLIKDGRIVAFPTGTSYGLAVDSQQGHAIQRLKNLKQRPSTKSFTIFMSENLWDEFLNLQDREREILQKFTGQPLTMLVEPKDRLDHLAQDNLIGVRTIDHPIMESLASTAGVPLTATSANITNQPPCFSISCIEQAFPGKIDETTYDLSLAAILDSGKLPDAEPTTIAKWNNDTIEIIRPGSISTKDLTQIIN